jgi:hypothetical protein
MTDKINVYINSKNRKKGETSSKFTVFIPQNTLVLRENEHFTLNINGFYCFNSWYNVQQNFNNHFQLHIYNDNNQFVRKDEYYLTPGNPSVLDLRSDLNYILAGEVSVSYDRATNKFRFRRILETSYTDYKMYLVIKNAEDLLGFKRSQRDELIELPYMEDVWSSYYVNVLGDEAVVISVSGDILLDNNNVDNFGTNEMKPTSVIFIKPIDVPSNSLLTYNNEDAGDSFQYKLANTDSINQFTLTVMNQDLEQIIEFNEYILNLQFVKHKTNNDVVSVLNSVLDYVREIYLMISGVIFKPKPQDMYLPQPVNAYDPYQGELPIEKNYPPSAQNIF